MPADPHVVDVIKPLARVVMEFTDGTVIEVNEGNIQREELFLVHSNYGLVALSLAVSTVGWKPNTADKVLINPTPVVPNRTDKRHVITHTPLDSGFGDFKPITDFKPLDTEELPVDPKPNAP